MRGFVLFSFTALSLFVGGSGWLALYPPVPADLDGAPNFDSQAHKVSIPVGHGDSLDAWVLGSGARGVIVALHGYGRRHDRMWRYASFLVPAGFTIVAPDFRSSRSRRREPTTLGHYELQDARAVLAWVHASPALRDRPLALLGESLGASVAIAAAAGDPAVRAVVADGAFASGRRALESSMERWAHLPGPPAAAVARWGAELATGYDPEALDVVAAARRLRGRPLMLVSAWKDDRISPDQARDLARAAGARAVLWEIPDAGHNQGWQLHRREYERRVGSFLARSLVAADARVGRRVP